MKPRQTILKKTRSHGVRRLVVAFEPQALSELPALAAHELPDDDAINREFSHSVNFSSDLAIIHALLPLPDVFRTVDVNQNQDTDHLLLLSIFHYVLGGLVGLFSLFPLIHLRIGVVLLRPSVKTLFGRPPDLPPNHPTADGQA